MPNGRYELSGRAEASSILSNKKEKPNKDKKRCNFILLI
jgi:hypothetical protein